MIAPNLDRQLAALREGAPGRPHRQTAVAPVPQVRHLVTLDEVDRHPGEPSGRLLDPHSRAPSLARLTTYLNYRASTNLIGELLSLL